MGTRPTKEEVELAIDNSFRTYDSEAGPEGIMAKEVMALRAEIAARDKCIEMKNVAIQRLLDFNEDLCDDLWVSRHYPSADNGRKALAAKPSDFMGEVK